MSADHEKQSEIDLTINPLSPQNPQPVPTSTEATRVNGFIGASDIDGHLRVYLDLSFTSFFEVAKESVVHAVRIDRDDANSPTTVLIDSAAHIAFVQTKRIDGAASYVAGAIRQHFSSAPATRLFRVENEVLVEPKKSDNPWDCATEPPKCTGPIFCPPEVQ